MPNPTSVAADTAACLGHADLFLHPLFDRPGYSLTPPQARLMRAMIAKAGALCLECPLMERCLREAVVVHDIAGFVAGTTPGQRAAMRARLGWRVEPESFDEFVGVSSHRPVNHDEILRLRRTHPDKTLEDIAAKLGCSLSTVKRHLRQERDGVAAPAPRPVLKPVPPSNEQIFAALRDVVRGADGRAVELAQAA